MATFRLSPSLAFTPQMIGCAGQFVVPANAATPNTQVLPALLAAGNAGTSQITPTSTVSPQGSLMYFYCTPNSAAAQPAANTQVMPRGVASGAQTAGSEFLIDCSGFSADIISAQAGIVTPGRGNQTVEAVVSAIDNVNKLLYVQVVSYTTGVAAAAPAGSVITFQVVMKDTYAI